MVAYLVVAHFEAWMYSRVHKDCFEFVLFPTTHRGKRSTALSSRQLASDTDMETDMETALLATW